MTQRPIDSSVPAGTVLRGAELREQAVTPGRGAARPGAQVLHVVPAPRPPAPAVSLDELREQARNDGMAQGLAEGREQGAREGALAAREEVLRRADDIISAAMQEATRLAVQQVTARIEAEGHQRWLPHKARLDALLQALPAQLEARLAAAEDDLLALCMDAVAHMLGDAAAQPQAVRAAIGQALARMRTRPLLRVKLNPADLDALAQSPGWTQWTAAQGESVQWVAAADVSPGGCIAESADGSLDARLDEQLTAFAALLRAGRVENVR